METLPTWDPFILVSFAIVTAYSFIVGRNATMKIIISTYIAILATDGIGNLVGTYILDGGGLANYLSTTAAGAAVIFKILVFVVAIVTLTIHGNFFVEIPRDKSMMITLATTTAFGVLSAGLIISTVLIYIDGGGFLGESAINTLPGIHVDITGTSQIAKHITENYNFWFSLPAISILFVSLISIAEGEE